MELYMKRKIFFTLVIFFLGYCKESKSILTQQDLTTGYETAKTLVATLQSQIQPLPKATKKTLNAAIQSTLDSIQQIYDEVQPQVKALEKKKGNEQKITIQVSNTLEKINTTVYSLQSQVTVALNQYQEKIGQQEATKSSKKAGELIQEKEKYERKLRQNLIKIQTILPAYNQALDTVQNILFSLYNKQYDQQKVETVTQEILSVAQQAFTVYKNIGPIKANDAFNLVTTILKKLSDIYNGLIAQQLARVGDQKRDNSYFKLLSQVSIQIIGSQKGAQGSVVRLGYDKVITQGIKKYFSDPIEQAKMVNYYQKKKIDTTYSVYTNALQSLASQLSKPTATQWQYILAIYNLIMNELAIVPKEQADGPAQAANLTVASLYVSSAQAIIQSMSIEKDMGPIIVQVIDLYKQAAHYFSLAQDPNALEYTKLYTALEKALLALKQAYADQQGGFIEKAIQGYQNAQTLFVQGGDTVDANKMAIILADLQGKYFVDTTKSSFNQFFSQNKTLFQEYLTYLNTLDTSVSVNVFHTMFNSLIKIYQAAYSGYGRALSGYKALPENRQSYGIVQIIGNLQMAVSLIDTLSQLYGDIQSGDQVLISKTAQALQEAGRYYADVFALSQLIDSAYEKNNALNDLLPRYFMQDTQQKENLNFTILAHRHNAKLELALANTMVDDLATAILYYDDAHKQSTYLTPIIDNFLTVTLAGLAQNSTVIINLFQNAQATERTLLSLSAPAWAAKATVAGYTSDAVSKWHALLHQYLTIYRLGYQAAKDSYNNAINEYIDQYKKNVPREYYSDLDLALIKYHQYILYLNENQQTEASTVLKEIETLVMNYFATVQHLIDSINETSLITTASMNQTKIIALNAELNSAVAQQATVINSVGPSLSTVQGEQARIVTKTIDQQGNITYTYVPTKKTVIIPNPIANLALVYKKLGNYYLSKKNYMFAYPYYYYAKQTYLQVGQTAQATSFDAELARSNSLYLAAQYRDLIIPQGTITLATFTVPESYLIKTYGQTVPSIFISAPEFSNLNFLQTDPKKAQNFLVALASKLYVYNKISDLFSIDRFNELFPLTTLSVDQLQNNATFKGMIDEQKVAFVSLVTQSAKFHKDLMDRVVSKKSTIVLQQKDQQTYILYEYDIPMPQFPDMIQFYQAYPSVTVYYYLAASYFQPGNPPNTVAQSALPPGNDPEEYAKMVRKQSETYLSQGYNYRSQIDALKASIDWKNLVGMDKKNITLSISGFSPLYEKLKYLFNQMSLFYRGPLSNNLVAQKSTEAQSLNKLLGDSYKEFGDSLMTFLKGDPLSHYYTMSLKDILDTYIVAIVSYNYGTNLYGDVAALYDAAGDLLVANKKYFDSISFFLWQLIRLRELILKMNKQKKLSRDPILNILVLCLKDQHMVLISLKRHVKTLLP